EFRDKRSSRRFVAWASTSTGSGTRKFRLLESQLSRSTLQAVGGQGDSFSHFSLQEVPTLTFFPRCDCLLPGIQPAQNQQMPNFGSEIRPASRNGSNKLGQAPELPCLGAGARMTLRIQKSCDDHNTTVRLCGRLVASQCQALSEQIESSTGMVAIDLEEVTLV